MASQAVQDGMPSSQVSSGREPVTMKSWMEMTFDSCTPRNDRSALKQWRGNAKIAAAFTARV